MKFSNFINEDVINESTIVAKLDSDNKAVFDMHKGGVLHFYASGKTQLEVFVFDTAEPRAIVLKNGKLVDDYYFDEDEWSQDKSKVINDYLKEVKK